LSDSGVRHHLAAILAADVAGYSRLMANDERATLAALDAARGVFRARIESRDGRVIDMAGDSVLAIFDSAKSAVKTALEIQKDLRPARHAPAQRRMQFRIGVHLGDVIEKADGTVYGDGVNIAARLQTKAPPGGICLSQTVYDTVQRKLPLEAQFGGRESFKNIGDPIPVWLIGAAPRRRKRWLLAPAIALLVFVLAGGWYWARRDATPVVAATDGKSVAVLPLVNISEDKDMDYFADGLHEDLLTQLALLGDLKVVSRTSVMEYRNSGKSARLIGRELGVTSLVEGSVRRSGNQVRLTAQLVDTRTDQHVWAKSYDRELKDIFAIQSELASEIAQALHVSLAPQEQTRLAARRPTENLDAYDLLLRHTDLVTRSTGTVRSVTTVKARIALLAKAVELDPKFALAWARLGAEHARAFGYGVDATPERRAAATRAMKRALALQPDDPQIKIELGVYYLYALYDNVNARAAYREVLKTAPNNIDALIGLADVDNRQLWLGESLALLERVLVIDPRNMVALVRLANEYRNLRHFDRALALRKQMMQIRPDDLDLQASTWLLEYWRTGSWTEYDRWRMSAPQNAHQKSFRVWSADFDRTVVRRDFIQALRLLEIVPEDVRGAWDSSDEARTEVIRALLLYAKGEYIPARTAARAALRHIDAELHKKADTELAIGRALMHALLGPPERALAAQADAVAMGAATGGLMSAEYARRASLDIAALLGERDAALAEVARQIPLPNFRVHALRVNLALASLWDDPKLDAIVNDPANNASLPFSVKYTPDK
jgi:TolB-like protein/class 3 adenylate cyclase/predicted TPR repeat methyltransferase